MEVNTFSSDKHPQPQQHRRRQHQTLGAGKDAAGFKVNNNKKKYFLLKKNIDTYNTNTHNNMLFLVQY